MKIQSAIERYVDQRTRAGRFRGRTPRTVGYILWQFVDHVGEIDTAQLTKRHIEGWVSSQHSRVRESTIYSRFSTLRAFCNWLRREELLRSDPFRDLDPPKKPEALPRSLTVEQVEKLFANLPDARAEVICSLIFQSALRVAEVASLEVGRIDLRDWTAKVWGKGTKERIVPIFEETQPLLLAYLAQFPARSGPLVRSYLRPAQGVTPTHITKLVSDWMYQAGIKAHAFDGVSAHAGRHTAATDTYERSKDIRAVQQFLGHSSLDVTQKYVKGSAAAIRAAGEGRKYRR
jgi:site-specific recombinase XerD